MVITYNQVLFWFGFLDRFERCGLEGGDLVSEIEVSGHVFVNDR